MSNAPRQRPTVKSIYGRATTLSRARKTWSTNFEQAVVSAGGRKLPVVHGMAWHVGRCVILLDAESERSSDIVIHAKSEPRDGGGGGEAAADSIDFQFGLLAEDPSDAAAIVLRWVKNCEGDQIGL